MKSQSSKKKKVIRKKPTAALTMELRIPQQSELTQSHNPENPTDPSTVPRILLRHCPPAIYERIGKTKMEIMQNNRFRGKVSNEEAIYKMLEKCGE